MTESDRAGLAKTNNLLKDKLLRWMPREYKRLFGEPPHRHVSQLRQPNS